MNGRAVALRGSTLRAEHLRVTGKAARKLSWGHPYGEASQRCKFVAPRRGSGSSMRGLRPRVTGRHVAPPLALC